MQEICPVRVVYELCIRGIIWDVVIKCAYYPAYPKAILPFQGLFAQGT